MWTRKDSDEDVKTDGLSLWNHFQINKTDTVHSVRMRKIKTGSSRIIWRTAWYSGRRAGGWRCGSRASSQIPFQEYTRLRQAYNALAPSPPCRKLNDTEAPKVTQLWNCSTAKNLDEITCLAKVVKTNCYSPTWCLCAAVFWNHWF